jgi:hypothetical protein
MNLNRTFQMRKQTRVSKTLWCKTGRWAAGAGSSCPAAVRCNNRKAVLVTWLRCGMPNNLLIEEKEEKKTE